MIHEEILSMIFLKNPIFLFSTINLQWGLDFSKEGVMSRLTRSHVHVLYPQKHVIVYAKWIIAYKIVCLCVQLPILYTQMLFWKSGPRNLAIDEKNQLVHMVSETEIMACLDYVSAVKYLSCLLFRVDSECIFRLHNKTVAWETVFEINIETFYPAATEDADGVSNTSNQWWELCNHCSV